jgi:hypothetical protein
MSGCADRFSQLSLNLPGKQCYSFLSGIMQFIIYLCLFKICLSTKWVIYRSWSWMMDRICGTRNGKSRRFEVLWHYLERDWEEVRKLIARIAGVGAEFQTQTFLNSPYITFNSIECSVDLLGNLKNGSALQQLLHISLSWARWNSSTFLILFLNDPL